MVVKFYKVITIKTKAKIAKENKEKKTMIENKLATTYKNGHHTAQRASDDSICNEHKSGILWLLLLNIN